MLLNQVFLSEGEGVDRQARSGFEAWVAALGFGRDFLDRLEEATASYVGLLQKEDRQHLTIGVDTVKDEEENKLRVCRARAQALEAAEAEFGEEAFLQVLVYFEPAANLSYAIVPLAPKPPSASTSRVSGPAAVSCRFLLSVKYSRPTLPGLPLLPLLLPAPLTASFATPDCGDGPRT